MHGQQDGIGNGALRRLIALCALIAQPALAADKSFSVTSFDRIRVEGPFAVTVVTGRAVSARARGDLRGLDALQLSVEGRTLTVRATGSGWGGYPGEKAGPIAIALATPELSVARVSGSGSLSIDRMRGARISAGVEGAGKLAIARADTDRLELAIAGTGTLSIAGTAKLASATVRGNGMLDAGGLSVDDLQISSEGGSAVTMSARHTAKVAASGTGDIIVLGKPACTVNRIGSGRVTCGEAKNP